MCRNQGLAIVGASRGESLDIVCEVESDPPAVSYRWKFNNSGETLDVDENRFKSTSNGTLSILRYTPVSDLDYGTLSCWAKNSVGHQVTPCVFQVRLPDFSVRQLSRVLSGRSSQPENPSRSRTAPSGTRRPVRSRSTASPASTAASRRSSSSSCTRPPPGRRGTTSRPPSRGSSSPTSRRTSPSVWSCLPSTRRAAATASSSRRSPSKMPRKGQVVSFFPIRK